jgi:hypothetical protein
MKYDTIDKRIKALEKLSEKQTIAWRGPESKLPSILTLISRRSIGNRANQLTANDIRANTCKLVVRRDASKTDANMAALRDTDA